MLPAPGTLERLAASVAAHAVQDLFERIAAGFPEPEVAVNLPSVASYNTLLPSMGGAA